MNYNITERIAKRYENDFQIQFESSKSSDYIYLKKGRNTVKIRISDHEPATLRSEINTADIVLSSIKSGDDIVSVGFDEDGWPEWSVERKFDTKENAKKHIMNFCFALIEQSEDFWYLCGAKEERKMSFPDYLKFQEEHSEEV